MVLVSAFRSGSRSMTTPTTTATDEHRLYPRDGAPGVIVWRSEKAHTEGQQLIRAGVNKTKPALLVPLIACIVDGGTRVLVTDAGMSTSDILVIEGANAGCRGNVSTQTFRKEAR
jgi:hypothetical protein